MAENDLFMTTREFADFIGIKESTVYSYLHYQQLPQNIYRSLDRKLIFIRQAVIDWILKGAKLNAKSKKKGKNE
jgi:predicted DNA-binding transcriptional regulator AlpA